MSIGGPSRQRPSPSAKTASMVLLPPQNRAVNGVKFARIDDSDEEQPDVQSKSLEVCWDFARNRCYRTNCRYVHAGPLTQVQNTTSLRPSQPGSGISDESRPSVQPIVTVDRATTEQYLVKLPCRRLSQLHQPVPSKSHTIPTPRDLRPNDSTPVYVVRLRGAYPPEPPSQNSNTSMYRDDDLSWDAKTNFRGLPVNHAAWRDSSTSSDESLTEGSSIHSTAGSSSSQRFSLPDASQTKVKHPPPPCSDVCRNWLRGRCPFGYRCKRVHSDLDYDSPSTISPPPPEPHLSITIHDHTQVILGSGFEISDITTSMETPWVILSDIPARVKSNAINTVLAPFGTVCEVKLPATLTKDVMIVRARFSSHAEALKASTGLDGSTVFSTRISARMPVNARNGMMDIQDSTVRLQWEAPSKVAYGGYPSLRRAEEAIAATQAPCDDYYVHAAVHAGLPSIGAVTVKFTNLPLGADEKSMTRFGRPEDIMWERPNYTDFESAVDGVKRTLHSLGDLRELDILPPPYSHGLVRAYATFPSPAVARSAAGSIHGRKPPWTGKTRISARHVQTLIYRITLEDYEKHASLIDALRDATFRTGCYMAVVIRRLPTSILIRLSAESTKALGWLKAEFETISRGEILRQDGVAAWDSFFGRPYSAGYLCSIRAINPDVRIEVDGVRRILRLFGTPQRRADVRGVLLRKLADLKAQQVRVIRVPGRVVNVFVAAHLSKLCAKFGADSIFVDMWERTVTLRGGVDLFEAGTDAIHEVQQSCLAQMTYRPNISECPVCFNQVVSPVTLPCRHKWCRSCFVQCLLAAVENRRFPLKCLGNEAKCTECIPLSIARNILQPSEFNSVVDAAVSSYVHTHAKELHYCPSPDCLQIYRTGPKGTVVQCPACLLRICPHCHAEAHDGFDCADRDGADKLFKEWAARHDVKNCPGCAIPIERDEGCHHVTCIQCQTHICWVCLKTFPKGEGIYKHMRAEHGGIGLGPGM